MVRAMVTLFTTKHGRPAPGPVRDPQPADVPDERPGGRRAPTARASMALVAALSKPR